MVGALGGQVVGSVFLGSITAGYVTFAVFSLVMLTLFIVFNPDYSSKELEPEPFRFVDFLRTFWVSPVKHPDFFWAFTGRLLLYTGYFAVTGYQFFLLTDYFGIADPGSVIPVLGLISLAGILIATIVSGPLSDKVGRRKPFVFASSAVTGARVPAAVGLARHHRVDDHDLHRGPRLRHVPGRRHGAHERGAAVGEVVREGPRRRQHRRDPAADPRARRRRCDRAHVRVRRASSRSRSCSRSSARSPSGPSRR